MFYVIATCTCFPSSARLDRPRSRKKGGKKTQGGFFRSMSAAAPVWATPLAAGSDARRVRTNRHSAWQLHVSRGARGRVDRAAFVAARKSANGQQPGRERPPSPAPRLFPAATQGVAHVPAASLRCALDSVRGCCREWSGNSGWYTPPLVARSARIRENERRVILTGRSRPCL